GNAPAIARDPSSNILANDPAVSYTHAQITRLGNDLYLRDVGSRNGTYVNAQMVTIPHLLRDGDRIHVGQSDLEFHAAVAAPAPAARPRAAPAAPPAAAPPPAL